MGEISRSVGKGHIQTEWHKPKESRIETFSKTNKSPTKYRPRKQQLCHLRLLGVLGWE